MSLYGLIIGIAIVVCFEIFSRRNNIIPKNRESFFLFSLVIWAIVGARAYHVADQWVYYSQNPLQVINLRAGGLGIFGALIFGFIYLVIFSKLNRIKLLVLLDNVASVLPLGQAIGRFGNHFNREIPVWWIESILCLGLFLIISRFPQKAFSKYLLGYGIIRLITESFRYDTWVISSLKIGYLLSLIFIISGIIILYVNRSTPKQSQKPL